VEVQLSEISKRTGVGTLGSASEPSESLPSELAHATAQSGSPPVKLNDSTPVFFSDSTEGADALDTVAIVQPLAQLCVTAQVQTPFLAAILGAPGAGKSFALKKLVVAIEALSDSAGCLARVVVAKVDAGDGAEAPIALASAAYAALDCEPHGVDYSALLDDLAHASGDPLRAAKAASDRHDEIVRKLEAERLHRDEAEARVARLSDALLFETPGSRVDVFARARRGAIDSRLRRFDLAGSDSAASYRELVRDLAILGPAGRAGVAMRSVWAYSSQRRLLLWATVAIVLGIAIDTVPGQDVANAIQAPLAQGGFLSGRTTNFASWLSSHGSWLASASKILFLLGALALAVALWRAIGFFSLLLHGTRLLHLDVRDRRRDLESRLARLGQRIADLSAEAETAAHRAEAAARRAGGKSVTRAPGPEFLDTRHIPTAEANAFLTALAGRVSGGSAVGAPNRFVFVIDNLDRLPANAAIAWIESAQSLIGAGLVGVMALDPQRLIDALGGRSEARRRFERWLQIVVSLPRRADPDGGRLMARLLDRGEQAPPAHLPELGAALVEPLSATEAALLTSLAPLAAHSPRGVKRFLNAYRLARCAKPPRAVTALMQAVAFADDNVQAAMRDRLRIASAELGDFDGPESLVEAVKHARAVNKGAITIADARAAEAVANRYVVLL
jgi:hypothetical protein